MMPRKNVKRVLDVGEISEMRRALRGLDAQENQEQKKAIFHTRCTKEGKVYSIIIDGGNCTNAASKTTGDELKLSIMSHPLPYTI